MANYSGTIPENQTVPKTRLPWAATAWFGALLMACYAPVLWGLMRQWATGEDMGHGFFVPVLAGFVAWRRRAELAAVEPSPNYWGLAIAAWGSVQMVLGTLAAQLFVA